MTDPPPSFESASVAAVLAQRSRDDRDALLDDLVAMLAGIVPGVQVDRSLLRRRLTAIRLPLAGSIYVLKRDKRDGYEASRQQEVRGVVVRTFPMEIDAFLSELAVAIDEELRRTEQGRAALEKWLTTNS
jgi:hypothetical protein